MCCLCYDKNYPNQLYPTNHAETRKRGRSQKHPQNETDSNSSAVSDGSAIIMISSELPEIVGLCDRVVVMAQGKVQGTLEKEEIQSEKIMALAADGGR